MLAFERQQLFDTLSALPPAQFGAISFALDPPSGTIPDDTAAQGKRVEALLNWAEGPGGVGLQTVQEVLYQTLGKTAPPQTAICPYKGLSYFDCNDRDHHYFYGREALTQTLLKKVEQENFLVIVGASGSGKSSVLRAGLLQQLQDRGDCEIRILVPGEQPLQNLGLAFVDETLERLERAHQLQTVDELMRKGATGLASLVRTSPQNRVVLVVDQFEEAFTLCHDLAERQAFFATLLGALAATNQLQLILAMRSDFVGKCFEADYSGLATQVKTHLEPVLPMSPAELTQAITAPAHQVGISLEPGLVEALLKDVDPTSGSLPLLQYTLTELWQRQQDHQLKLSTYMQLGGVTGTLQQRADTVYTALTPDQQHTAKHIFLSLTQLGEMVDSTGSLQTPDTRRRITQTSLISAQHPEAQIVAVVKQLADANLVVTDERTLEGGERSAIVDVAHEALIRNWPKLCNWLDENRDLLRQQRRIEQAAKEWDIQNRKPGYLWQGLPLSEAKRAYGRRSELYPLSRLANSFIQASSSKQKITRSKIAGAFLSLTVTFAIFAEYVNRENEVRSSYDRLSEESTLELNRYERMNQRKTIQNLISGCSKQSFKDWLPSFFRERLLGNCRSLEEMNLSGTYLFHLDLSFVNLKSVNLDSAYLNQSRFIRVDFENADLNNTNLYQADLRGASFARTSFRAVNLSEANLANSLLSHVQIDGSQLSKSIFEASMILWSDFDYTNLEKSNLSKAFIVKTDFHGSKLHKVEFSNTIILATDFRNAQGLSEEQFSSESLPLICNSLFPEKIAIDPNRDCSRLPLFLHEHYPFVFETLEDAEKYVKQYREIPFYEPRELYRPYHQFDWHTPSHLERGHSNRNSNGSSR